VYQGNSGGQGLIGGLIKLQFHDCLRQRSAVLHPAYGNNHIIVKVASDDVVIRFGAKQYHFPSFFHPF